MQCKSDANRKLLGINDQDDKMQFPCFLNSHEQPLEIGLGDVIYTSKTNPEFSVPFCL